ncbi:MAG: hypothetical protein E6554_12235 [Bacteroides sp.]|nr:hypothetical protein [Bacteroides sp.]
MILLARNEIIYVVFFPPISARTILMAAKNADNLDFYETTGSNRWNY